MNHDGFPNLISALQTIATGAAVWVAYRGLRTWQLQLHGTVEYECARKVYRAVLEVREQISLVRNSWISPGESAAALAEGGVDERLGPIERLEKASELVYQRRWKGLLDARVTLSAELLEAEALWGDVVQGPSKKLSACIGELYAAVMWHLRERSTSAFSRREQSESSFVLQERMQAVLYCSWSDDSDEFGERVLASVREFEELLKPHMRSRRSQRAS